MEDLNLGWVPITYRQARMAISYLVRTLEHLGVLCAIVHGDCVEDFETAKTLNLFLVVEDEERARFVSRWLGKVIGRYEREIGRILEFTIVTIDELDEYTPSELDEILNSGIQLICRLDRGLILRAVKQKYVLFTYDASTMRVRDKLDLRKELYGTEEVARYGPFVYKMTRDGLVSKLGGVRIASDAFVVPEDRAKEVIEVLERKGIRYFAREVSLSESDIRRMRTHIV